MTTALKPYENIIDFVTGKAIPNIGAEENRQAVERILVEEKGFPKSALKIDFPIEFSVGGAPHVSAINIMVFAKNCRPLMAVKCAAGSLGSYEREAVSAARLAADPPVGLALVSDGKNATMLETQKGRVVSNNWQEIPDFEHSDKWLLQYKTPPLSPKRLDQERLIFRTYDAGNVNVGLFWFSV
ncbi:MAG: type I restriction enzyme HsdR N-terminal domain-containing protein, partial [Desulfatibacillaceae bacterium]|nr:type I restriction enzyme HsdR N-terminal domain-containing protein [Desulfatibacillaceae bacterium]